MNRWSTKEQTRTAMKREILLLVVREIETGGFVPADWLAEFRKSCVVTGEAEGKVLPCCW